MLVKQVLYHQSTMGKQKNNLSSRPTRSRSHSFLDDVSLRKDHFAKRSFADKTSGTTNQNAKRSFADGPGLAKNAKRSFAGATSRATRQKIGKRSFARGRSRGLAEIMRNVDATQRSLTVEFLFPFPRLTTE